MYHILKKLFPMLLSNSVFELANFTITVERSVTLTAQNHMDRLNCVNSDFTGRKMRLFDKYVPSYQAE